MLSEQGTRSPHHRKYAMTRLRKGDYLLPSNDAQTLWRIRTYEEDGSLVNVLPDGTEKPVTGTFWALWKRPMPKQEQLIDPEDFDQWQFWSGPLKTREEAIKEALLER